MQSDSEGSAPLDAVGPFDRRRASRVLHFASEIDAEQWEQDGRLDESPYAAFGAGSAEDRRLRRSAGDVI